MIDIKEGDIFIVDSEEHPVKAVELWPKTHFHTEGFKRMANVTASTKRTTMTSGKRGLPTTNLTGLSCTPLDPVSTDVIERLALESPLRLRETFIADDTGFVHLIIEDLQHV